MWNRSFRRFVRLLLMLGRTLLTLLLCFALGACGDDPEAPPLDLEDGEGPPVIRTGSREDELTASAGAGETEPDSREGAGEVDDADDPPATTRSPENLAASILDVMKELLLETGRLGEDDLDTATVVEEFDDHRERAIVKLVELGRHRERLDQEQKDEVVKLVKAQFGAALRENFQAYSQLRERLTKEEPAFARKIAGDFPKLTDYAYFEVLRAEKPKEAERLGVD